MAEVLEERDYKCWISGIPFTSPWEITMERKNNDLTYLKDNCEPMLRYFQTPPHQGQWTPERFKKAPAGAIDLRASRSESDTRAVTRPRRSRRPASPRSPTRSSPI